MKKYQAAFTLIELMIAVALLAILVAVAMPSYQQHVLKSRRSEAKVVLLQAAQLQERNFTVNGTYVNTANLAPLFGLANGATIYSGDSPGPNTSFYIVTVNAPDANCPLNACFVLTATPQRNQTADICGQLTLSSTGQQGVIGAGVTAADCWSGRR
jgi:type IV pilus assembly protein PilE